MGGLRFDSLADMPEGMRKLAAPKVAEVIKEKPAKAAPADSKYHNTEVDHKGIHFKSLKEARRYDYLMYCLDQGFITDLKLQEEFTLQSAYTAPNGERIRAIRYLADFTYKVGKLPPDPLQVAAEDAEHWQAEGPGAYVVEDVKSKATRTDKYKMKKKMMAERLGLFIRET